MKNDKEIDNNNTIVSRIKSKNPEKKELDLNFLFFNLSSKSDLSIL